MSLNGISLQKGSTGITVVGGTATVFETDGAETKAGIHVVDTTEPNFLLRQHATFKNKPHAVQPNGSFSKGYRNSIVSIPHTLSDGTTAYMVGRITIELHPQCTLAQINELRRMTVQAIIDAETDNYYYYGSIK